MALQKEAAHPCGITVGAAYWRLLEVRGSKVGASAVFGGYLNKDVAGIKAAIQTVSIDFVPTPGAGDWDAQAYQAAKSNPAFEGALDC